MIARWIINQRFFWHNERAYGLKIIYFKLDTRITFLNFHRTSFVNRNSYKVHRDDDKNFNAATNDGNWYTYIYVTTCSNLRPYGEFLELYLRILQQEPAFAPATIKSWRSVKKKNVLFAGCEQVTKPWEYLDDCLKSIIFLYTAAVMIGSLNAPGYAPFLTGKDYTVVKIV